MNGGVGPDRYRRSGAAPARERPATARRDPPGLLAASAIALAARLGYWALLGRRAPSSDAAQYAELARNLASGHGFSMYFPQIYLHPTAFRPPLYPFLLAGAFRVFGSHVVVGQVLNVALGLVVVALAFLLTRQLAGDRAATISALVVALYPPLIANDVVLLTEPLSLALLLGTLLALSHRRWAVAGVLCGLLILTRPSAQLLLVVVVVWVLWQLGWRRALGVTAVAGVVVMPWVVRNWVVMGSPVLVTSNGFNLAAMYSPQARESGGFVDAVADPRFGAYRLAQFNEVAWQRSCSSWRSTRSGATRHRSRRWSGATRSATSSWIPP